MLQSPVGGRRLAFVIQIAADIVVGAIALTSLAAGLRVGRVAMAGRRILLLSVAPVSPAAVPRILLARARGGLVCSKGR